MKKTAPYILVLILALSVPAGARQLRPGSDDYKKFETAQACFAAGDYEQARNILTKIIRDYDDDPGLNYLLARSFQKLEGVQSRNYARKYLKKAVQLQKDSLDWKYELGRLLRQSDMDLSALEEFSELIGLDSGYYAAYLESIDLCIARFCHNGNTDKLAEGYRYAVIGLARFKGDQPLLFKKSLVAMLFQAYDEAVKILAEIENPDTLQNEILLLDGYLNYQMRQFGRSYVLFEKALAGLPEQAKSGYSDLTLLLSPVQKKEYLTLSDSARRAYADSYWAGLDPDPTTALNEKIVEHYARVYYADLRYGLPEKTIPGWETDQGKLFIRYGPPVSAKWHLPEDEDPQLNCRWEWIYNIKGLPISLTFLNLVGGDNYRLAPLGYGSDDEKAFRLISETPAINTFAYKSNLINSVFSYFIYKGSGGESLLDLFIATPYDQFVYEPSQGHAVCEVEYRTALRDLADNPVRRDSLRQRIVISPTLSENPDFYHFATITIPAPAESLKVACAIEQKSAQRVNIYEQNVRIHNFADSGFHLSSLILAAKVAEQEKDSPFNRRDFKLIPSFTNTYRITDTLVIYYEIYDLPTDIRGRTHYRLTYSIRQEKLPRGIMGLIADLLTRDIHSEITHIAERGDIRTELYEPLKIDISSLRPGLYEFTLSIEEYVLGKTLTRKMRFSVVDEDQS